MSTSLLIVPRARNGTRVIALVLVGLALALALLARSAPAEAAVLPPITTFQNLATGYVVDGAYGPVNGEHRYNTRSQKWRIAPSAHGTITMKNVWTGRCLDSDTHGSVYALRCNGGNFQKWQVIDSDHGTVVLKNLATGRVLDGDAARRIYTLPSNGGSYQKWFIRNAA